MALNDGKTKPCRFWHRWTSIEESQWVGGIAHPLFLMTCRRCGAKKHWRAGP